MATKLMYLEAHVHVAVFDIYDALCKGFSLAIELFVYRE